MVPRRVNGLDASMDTFTRIQYALDVFSTLTLFANIYVFNANPSTDQHETLITSASLADVPKMV